jgi:outer membrane biosynthesis protein TonB
MNPVVTRRSSASWGRRVPRIAAGVAALAVNALVLVVLMTPSRGSGGFRAETPEHVMVFSAETTPAAHEPPPKPVRHEPHGPVGAPIPRATLDIPAAPGPPTESPASIAQNIRPDRSATVIDVSGLRDACQHAYPADLTSEQAEGAVMTLRVFVMADGRIGQGTVTSSSGDADLDWLTLKCLQIYAHLEPATDDELPAGSWQRLTWRWSLP